MIKISIIVPCFKRIDQTIKTIDLITKSSGFNKDYYAEIIVADSSPDNELKITLQKKFGNKIFYCRPKQPGIAANKNQGARVAKNPILIFCDSDMEVESNTIINTITALKKYKTAAAIGGRVIWKGGPKNGKNDRPRPEDRQMLIDKTIYIEALYSRYIATYKKVFWQVGGYDEKVFNMRGEGSDLSVRYWRAGYPLVYDDSIVVHHVHKVKEGIIRGVAHPEWGIAKDLLLLIYKYDIDDQNKNFVKTVAANFEGFGQNGYYRILEGINKHLDFITKVKPVIDQQKINMRPIYGFKFLEIFSQKKLFEKCIREAEKKLLSVRNIALND